ncbi:DUF192 domain-containing protein [Phytohalomonas tamaricis]|uniref:DUF192 domain-containing protein n=1 Tax=Phytohalomonas tamaricis TaxID=2081032 RepID=UPI0021D40B84|nr:DUF192 domain-containing protein [Phytohalomonas tamaricis]
MSKYRQLIAYVIFSLPSIAPALALEHKELTVEGAARAHHLQVEIARTPRERAVGLMERESLAADAGMLFIYTQDQPGDSGFWMYRTRIALDIAFLGANGEIRSIHTMMPCRGEAQNCPSYRPGRPYRAALEVNAGYFEQHGIGLGDCVSLAGVLEGCQR